MPVKLGIIITHGMGNQDRDFAKPTIDEINARLKKLKTDSKQVAWEDLFWADVIEPREQALWDRVSAKHDLDYVKIRRFVISALGDAVAYQRVPGHINTYRQIHDRVRDHLTKLRTKMGDQDLPVIVIAHSLGTAIMSDYIWDRQKQLRNNVPNGTPTDSTPTSTPTERLENLIGFITFGSTLPLFSLAFSPVVAIDFPPATLPDPLKPVAKWLNFFDEDDVLGYPLKPSDPSYDRVVTEDIEINAGSVFSSWNPLSHNGYWTDNDFTKPVAEQIAAVLKMV